MVSALDLSTLTASWMVPRRASLKRTVTSDQVSGLLGLVRQLGPLHRRRNRNQSSARHGCLVELACPRRDDRRTYEPGTRARVYGEDIFKRRNSSSLACRRRRRRKHCVQNKSPDGAALAAGRAQTKRARGRGQTRFRQARKRGNAALEAYGRPVSNPRIEARDRGHCGTRWPRAN